MDILQNSLTNLSRFFSEGGDELLIPLIILLTQFKDDKEERSSGLKSFDFNSILFFGALFFILFISRYFEKEMTRVNLEEIS
ncbi:MAG TPA: hypothetical protein PK733_04770 [Clostridiales bacterium]|mgnify:CR=1 FL=1|nr:hypothetical protein [Clostridiales bacterium]